MASNARWTYRTEHNSGNDRTTIAIQTVPAYVTARCFQAPTQYTPQCPPTPRIPFLPLPGYPIQYRPRTPDLFPIDLSQPGLSPAEATRLCASLPARTTISVRDIANQVLCNVKTGAVPMTTADLVQFLQHFVGTPLASYAGLSSVVQYSVEVNFVSRYGARARAVWERFARGTPRFGGPTGLDLLLGNTILWFLDLDISGVWIATVDVPRQPPW